MCSAPSLSLPRKRGRERWGAVCGQFLTDRRDIAAEDGRQIRIHHSGVAAADQLDQRRDLVADRHLRKIHLAGELGDALLMLRVAVGVHEHDGDGLDTVVERARKLGANALQLQLQFDRTVGADALLHFGDPLEQHLRLDDVLCKNLRPRLVADAERIAEALGRQQQGALALALQERVGRDRGAHLDRADPARRDWLACCQAEQIADALDRSVAIGLRVLGQKLVRHQCAVRPPPDHVGEGAAAVDPEVPRTRFVLVFFLLHASLKHWSLSFRGAAQRRTRNPEADASIWFPGPALRAVPE
jgi:hypothetical protein